MIQYFSLNVKGNPPAHGTPTLNTSYLDLLFETQFICFSKFDMQSSIAEMYSLPPVSISFYQFTTSLKFSLTYRGHRMMTMTMMYATIYKGIISGE